MKIVLWIPIINVKPNYELGQAVMKEIPINWIIVVNQLFDEYHQSFGNMKWMEMIVLRIEKNGYNHCISFSSLSISVSVSHEGINKSLKWY